MIFLRYVYYPKQQIERDRWSKIKLYRFCYMEFHVKASLVLREKRNW